VTFLLVNIDVRKKTKGVFRSIAPGNEIHNAKAYYFR
jgi:hypothetical protein